MIIAESERSGKANVLQQRAPTISDLEARLLKLRTELNGHAGDLEIVSFEPESGALKLRFLGACAICNKRAITFSTAILPLIEIIPGVNSVVVENFDVSDAVVDRIQSMLLPQDKRRKRS